MQRYLKHKETLAGECEENLDERHTQIHAAIEDTGKNIYYRFINLDRLYNAGVLKHHVYTQELRQLETFLLDPDLVNSRSLEFAEMLAAVNNHLN